MRENFVTVCIVEWWKNIKIDGKYLSNRKVVEEASRQCLVRDFKNLLSEDGDTLRYTWPGYHLRITDEGYLKMLESLASSCWDWCRSEEGRECFEDMLMNCLARGHAAGERRTADGGIQPSRPGDG